MADIVRTIGAAAHAGLLVGSALFAEQPGPAGAISPQQFGTTGTTGPRFRSGVDLVALSVVVTDAQGRFVGGLSADDFTVLEDGVSQTLSFFASMPTPIDLAILLDISA